MIRKKICLLLSFAIVISLFGCGQTKATPDENVEASSEEGAGTLILPTVPVSADSATSGDIDVDLTSLSSTFVYSEVYNMMTQPDDYIGKKICMEGQFSHYHDDTTGKDYYACIIQDATACCAQGIEFELEGEHTYPDDYPEEGTIVKVEGVFDTYMEGENKYCTLRDAHMF